MEKKSIPTFKLYTESYMDTYSATNHKPSTHDSYRSTLDIHLKKRVEGLFPGYIKIIKVCLSSILSGAIDDELIQL